MINVLRSEWVKLRRPAYLWVPFGITFLFATLFMVLGILNAELVPDPNSDTPGNLVTDYTDPHGAVTVANSIYGLIGMIALVIFAAAIATEYTHGTIRNLLIREPRRVRLMIFRWAALISWVGCLVAVLVITCIISGLIAMNIEGYPVSAWFEADGLKHIGSTFIYLWLALSLFASFGAILALVLKTPVAAIGIGIAWFLIVESLLGGLLSGTKDWLPGSVIASVGSGGDDAHGFWDGLALAAGYIAVLGGAALAMFNRNDVAS